MHNHHMRILWWLVASSFFPALFAQDGVLRPVEPFGLQLGLARYLDLSDAQASAINQANRSFSLFAGQKARRSAQVQMEIAQETAKASLDAMGLGLRYLELEAIRRELAAEDARARTTVQNLLTPAQKAKVQLLVEAVKLQPIICEAQANRIMPVIPIPAPGVLDAVPGNPAAGLLIPTPTGISFSAPGCFTPAVRFGDFVVPPLQP